MNQKFLSVQLWEMRCKCGEQNCRKVISQFYNLPDVVQKRYLKPKAVPQFILQKYLQSTPILTIMPLSNPEKLILHSLGQFYLSVNQPLIEKPVRVRTSKIAFIELMLKSNVIRQQERALYKNLEGLGKKKLIRYDNRMIAFTPKGLKELDKVKKEIKPFMDIEQYFRQGVHSPRKFQTVMES